MFMRALNVVDRVLSMGGQELLAWMRLCVSGMDSPPPNGALHSLQLSMFSASDCRLQNYRSVLSCSVQVRASTVG